MNLFNTLTRQVETIEPLNAPTVTVYTCGPTVYDYSHIGHWFTYVRMDMLIRALKADKLTPKWVMNITDVGHLVSDADEGEDKLEKGAKREGKTAWEVAEFYTEDFLIGMHHLNIQTPDYIVKATDHIKEQIDLIQKLEEKGFTYVIDDGVYYDTSKFPGYGSFARLDLDDLQAGARVQFNPQKKSITDFALWKFSPKDQKRDMEWNSPWGKGFPGWHIECSAMSMHVLGPTLDIHTGGIDHIPTHHTNEIAQSEAATGKRFANTWMHSNHVLIGGEKISKSLGNGIRLQDIAEKEIPFDAIRLHILESHYRNQSKFSLDNLIAAKNRLADLYAISSLRFQATDKSDATKLPYFKEVPEKLASFITNDLDTPGALAYLSSITSALLQNNISSNEVDDFSSMIAAIDQLTGLRLMEINDITDEQKSKIARRQSARAEQKWDESDQIRDELLKQGIGLKDYSENVIWFPAL
ncbi:MAG: cysteine--tRNA ligase [Candidatus Saccharimonadales bacterium]